MTGSEALERFKRGENMNRRQMAKVRREVILLDSALQWILDTLGGMSKRWQDLGKDHVYRNSPDPVMRGYIYGYVKATVRSTQGLGHVINAIHSRFGSG